MGKSRLKQRGADGFGMSAGAGFSVDHVPYVPDWARGVTRYQCADIVDSASWLWYQPRLWQTSDVGVALASSKMEREPSFRSLCAIIMWSKRSAR